MEFVVFLRNVNLGQPKSPDREQFESAFLQAGASNAVSFLSNGTLIYSVSESSQAQITAYRACDTLKTICGMNQPVFVRGFQQLANLVADDPFSEWNDPGISERAITFFEYKAGMILEAPIETERKDCLIFRIDAGEAFSITREVNGKIGYPTPLLEKALGAPVTTRSWLTIQRMIKKYGEAIR